MSSQNTLAIPAPAAPPVEQLSRGGQPTVQPAGKATITPTPHQQTAQDGAEQYQKNQQTQAEGEQEYSDWLYQHAPDEYKQAKPVDYAVRKIHDVVTKAAERGIEHDPEYLREAIRPHVDALADAMAQQYSGGVVNAGGSVGPSQGGVLGAPIGPEGINFEEAGGVQRRAPNSLGRTKGSFGRAVDAAYDVERASAPKPTSEATVAAGGSGALSSEEVNRPEVFVKYSKSGQPTYLGKQPDATLKPGEAVIAVDPKSGKMRVQNTSMISDNDALQKFGPHAQKNFAPQSTAADAVQKAGGTYRGTNSGGLVEVTLPRSMTDQLPIQDRFKDFVSVTMPENKITPDTVKQAMQDKFVQMGGKPEPPTPLDFKEAYGDTGAQVGSQPESQRISTRLPTAVKATEDPMAQNLIVGRQAFDSSPAHAQKIADMVKEYPGFNPTSKDANGILDEFQNHVADNLKYLYNSVPEEQRNATMKWYDSANGLAKEEADKNGYTHAQASGAIAAMSPQKDWDMNVSLARRVMDINANHQDTVTTSEMLNKGKQIVADTGANEVLGKLMKKLKGKSFGQLTDPVEKAAWVRLYDEAHNSRDFHSIDPGTGKNAGLRTTKAGDPAKVAWGSLNEISKALSILKDGSRQNISDSLGSMHKVRNFYNNIIEPNAQHGDVTIDTHAVAAGLMRPLSGNSEEVIHNFSTPKHAMSGSAGSYPVYADAYRQAAKDVGIMPRQMQSVVWEKIREMFPNTFKSKENAAAISDMWKDYENGKQSLDATRQRIVDFARSKTGK